MTIDRYTSQPIVGNIRVYELFRGHRVFTERDRRMNSRLIDKFVDGVQLELPDGMPGVKFASSEWHYRRGATYDHPYVWITVKEILEGCESDDPDFINVVSRCVAFWDIAVRNLDNALPDAVDEYMAAVMQRDAWLSLLEEKQ